MSFCSQVKEEACKIMDHPRHCQIAELASLIAQYGETRSEKGEKSLIFTTENAYAYRKYFTLLRKTFNIENGVAKEEPEPPRKGVTYTLVTKLIPDGEQILKAVKMWDPKVNEPMISSVVDGVILKSSCCRRAFLRGAFLCCGSMNDPGKSYHMELVCREKNQADQMIELLSAFDIDAKSVLRRNDFVVYVKESEGIVEMLGLMETHVALMELENVRILKEIGNRVNRGCNCETANLQRTISASTKQVSDIEYIRDHYGFESLPESLKEIAEVRLRYRDDSYEQLGKRLTPAIGKSGVNHRLRKLGEIADKVRDRK